MEYVVFDLEFNQGFDKTLNKTVSNERCPFEIIQIGAIKLDSHFKKFVSTKKNTVLCVWGTGDLKELFRNITYYDLPYKTLTKSYINIQHYASRYFNNPAGKSIGLQNAIQILNLDQDKSYHNALNDAYYTAQVFIRIYNPSIVPDVYMYTTVKPSSAKKNIKKQINYDKLFAEFAKILQRDLTKEDKK